MKMSIKLLGKKKIPIRPPPQSEYVEIDEECPNCKDRPVILTGGGKHIAGYDTYEAPAICCKCEKVVGTFYAKVSTIFGLEEDEAVMRMGAKIY